MSSPVIPQKQGEGSDTVSSGESLCIHSSRLTPDIT